MGEPWFENYFLPVIARLLFMTTDDSWSLAHQVHVRHGAALEAPLAGKQPVARRPHRPRVRALGIRTHPDEGMKTVQYDQGIEGIEESNYLE